MVAQRRQNHHLNNCNYREYQQNNHLNEIRLNYYQQDYYDKCIEAAAYIGISLNDYQQEWIDITYPREFEIFANAVPDNFNSIDDKFKYLLTFCSERVLNQFGV